MINWTYLDNNDAIEDVVDQSYKHPCLIFKHSIRCSLSAIAKHRLENDWDFNDGELQPFFLDLINYRALSTLVADRFAIEHESPQVLLIKDGICTYNVSHLDIKVRELHECV